MTDENTNNDASGTPAGDTSNSEDTGAQASQTAGEQGTEENANEGGSSLVDSVTREEGVDAGEKDTLASSAGASAEGVEPVTVESLTMPEGVEFDEAGMEDFLGIINDTTITPQERAQALIDMQAKTFNSALEAASNEVDQMQADWAKEVRQDPELGGAKFAQTRLALNKVMARFGTDGLRQAFNLTGAGSHPEVVRFLVNVSKALGESTPVPGNPTPTPKSDTDILYGE